MPQGQGQSSTADSEQLASTQVRGLQDVKAKYNKCSVALLRFSSSALMWGMMRSKPALTFNGKDIWFSLPNSF